MPTTAIADQLNPAYHDSLIRSNEDITNNKPQSNTRSNISPERIERTRDYLVWRNNVSDCLYEAGLDDEAEKWNDCSDPALCRKITPDTELSKHDAAVCACSHDPSHFARTIVRTCDLRVCPDCAARQSARLMERYMPIALELAKKRGRYRLVHLILTTKFSLHDDDIKERLKSTYDRLKRFLERIGSQGSIVAAEFGENGYLLHFHVLAFAPFVPKKQLSDEWVKISGNAPVTYIRQVVSDEIAHGKNRQGVSSAVAEVLKYSVKFFKRHDDGSTEYLQPELVPRLLIALKGARRIRTYGLFYNIEYVEPVPVCPECGSTIAVIWPTEWEIFRNTGWNMDEYRQTMRGLWVDLKLANKSSPEKRGESGTSPPEQPFLPNFGTTGRYVPENR